MTETFTPPAEISPEEFRDKLRDLFNLSVGNLSPADKQHLATEYISEFAAEARKARPALEIIPSIPGRRPIDEALHPGYGCSEQVGIISTAPDVLTLNDEVWLIYKLNHLDHLPQGITPDDLEVRMSFWFVVPMQESRELFPVPGLSNISVPPQTLSTEDYPQPILNESSFAQAASTHYVARVIPDRQLRPNPEFGSGWAWEDIDERFRQQTPDGNDPYTFAHQFHQRVRVELALYGRQELLSKQTIDLEIFDVGRFGSLYARLIEQLVKPDTQVQALQHGQPDWHFGHHPWFPVLAIGTDKANLYMRGIIDDLEKQYDNLPDPHWLLRVGLYLELLTCLGIFVAVKDEYPNLLSEVEWQLFTHSPLFAEIRNRINVPGWKKVWQIRSIAAPSSDILAAGPVSLTNLLGKQKAILGFLHTHHNDLKHAIELAGPNLYHSQETWHRVFRDAERAVLKNNLRAFPELRHLSKRYSDFAFWHRKGQLKLLGVNLTPEKISGLFGDQDGIFPSACHQYRESMNEVAQWAYERGLMDYTGDECIPPSASLLEAYMTDNTELLATLQRRDGYGPTLELTEPLPRAHVPNREEIAEMLRLVEIFDPLDDEEIKELAKKVHPKRYGPFDRVVIEGQPGHSLFVVASGTLEVLVRQPDGHDLVVDTNEAGSVFGEIALLTGGDRTATVRALTEAVLYEINKEQLQSIIRSRPQLISDLSVMMANRQSNVHRRSENYGVNPAETDRISKQLTARFLGTSTQSHSTPVPKKGKQTAPLVKQHDPLPHEEDIETILHRVPIFQALHVDEIHTLARNVQSIHSHTSDRIITHGQPGSSLFIVAAGTFDVLARGEDGHDHVINHMQPGAVFGEFALLLGGERTATVRAMSDGLLYEITKEQFQPIVEARPHIIDELSVMMANRQATEKAQRLTKTEEHKQAEGLAKKIHSFLLGKR